MTARRTAGPALRATYRLQLRSGVDFDAARRLVPQLERLGVSHLYLSPVLRARRGSAHGYDVVDPTEVDPTLGGETGLATLAGALHRRGMGLVVDVVPNHMAADPESPAFAEVLAHGPAAARAPWFDVDWGPSDRVAAGRHAPLALPWLGAPWPEAAARGEIALVRHRDRVRLRHGKGPLPVDPAGVAALLRDAARRPGARRAGVAAPLEAIAGRARRLPPRAPDRRGERGEAVAAWEASLARLLRRAPDARRPLDAALGAASPVEGRPGRERLGRVLAAGAYRLGEWRRTARRLNWRRFFDVNELIALRCEDPEVFAATHARVLAAVEAGWLAGLRVDHVDGLADPGGYLRRLREAIDERLPARARPGFGLWVEKILARGEALPRAWPVDGTTGYEHARDVDALLVDAAGFARLERDWRRRTGVRHDFATEAVAGKRRAVDALLAADLARAAEAFRRETAGTPTGARGTPPRAALRTAIRELAAHLDRYRPYAGARGRLEPDAREAVREALDRARRAGRAAPAALDAVGRRLLAPAPRRPGAPPDFRARFAQLSGPVAAKGIEDTALYRYTPLLSLCEVGAEPDAPLERAVADFHAGCGERVRRGERSLLAGSTHDSKRSADLRARLDALSECPEAWTRTLDALERHGEGLRRAGAPDARDRHAIYQTLVGLWPLGAPRTRGGLPNARVLGALSGRLATVAEKAAREAKRRTSWLDPEAHYEAALVGFVRGLLDPARSREALRGLDAFVRDSLAGPALWNLLARVVLQGTAPGAPDLYQGDELPVFCGVDPDNRRPVDFAAHRRRIEAQARGRRATPAHRRRALAAALSEPDGGRVKLAVLDAVLDARRAAPALFLEGEHRPLAAAGPRSDHVVAFARRRGRAAALVVVARRGAGASGDPGRAPVGESVWGHTRLLLPHDLASRRWRSALTGEALRGARALALGRLLDPLPVAVWLAGVRRPARRARD